ncbi:MAG: hypothetical protein M3P18_23530 [Actinomycetota bacterium]|nr:hypothetical protein [Actinomycetota bacterium]
MATRCPNVEGLRKQQEPVSELAWLRFHCNRIAGRERPWLAAGAWQACEGETHSGALETSQHGQEASSLPRIFNLGATVGSG